MNACNKSRITFLGTSSARPSIGSDTASFLINGTCLVDTGWSAVSNLRSLGVDPKTIKYILFTHMHHDHYMSLPSLLYFMLPELDGLKIVGPDEDVALVVRLALEFMQKERYFTGVRDPQVIPLRPGQSYEDENFRVDTCASLHPVQGLCYRYTDKFSEGFFSFVGDTAYHPPVVEHVRGSKLLIHEASLGPIAADPEVNKKHLHSGALDAARVAREAEVGKLILVHGPRETAEECVRVAQKAFGGPVEWPADGQSILV